MEVLLARLGDEIEDVDEETFQLFSQPHPSQDLGMIDPKTDTLELTIAGRDYEIAQSPGILHSKREGGTTGAVVWQSTARFVEWLESPHNHLLNSGLISTTATVLELGTGISGVVPCILSPRVGKVVATDQPYVLKAMRRNIEVNMTSSSKQSKPESNIDIHSLDWEVDDAASVLHSIGLSSGVDVLVACDCIYNLALIDAFVQTCADICSLRQIQDDERGAATSPTAVVVVQQLRQPEVFDQWLTTFRRSFQVWSIPCDPNSGLSKEFNGFAIHVGVLRAKGRSDD